MVRHWSASVANSFIVFACEFCLELRVHPNVRSVSGANVMIINQNICNCSFVNFCNQCISPMSWWTWFAPEWKRKTQQFVFFFLSGTVTPLCQSLLLLLLVNYRWHWVGNKQNCCFSEFLRSTHSNCCVPFRWMINKVCVCFRYSGVAEDNGFPHWPFASCIWNFGVSSTLKKVVATFCLIVSNSFLGIGLTEAPESSEASIVSRSPKFRGPYIISFLRSRTIVEVSGIYNHWSLLSHQLFFNVGGCYCERKNTFISDYSGNYVLICSLNGGFTDVGAVPERYRYSSVPSLIFDGTVA